MKKLLLTGYNTNTVIVILVPTCEYSYIFYITNSITGPQFDFRFLLVNHHIKNASVWPLPYKVY